jgi:hypothetical protein
MLNDSLDHPIFAVCHTDYCPHCVGIPDAIRNYAAQLGTSTNVVFTLINCQKTDACQRLNSRGVPSFRFLRGTNARYWVATQERGLPGWADFLEKVNGPIARKVDSAADRLEPQAGSTAFHLAVPDSGEVLAQYRRAATPLRLYGCSFSYSYETIAKPLLTAFLSDSCTVSIRPTTEEEIAQFLAENKFAATHEYDGPEFEDRDRNRALALLVSNGRPSGKRLQALDALAKRHCTKIRSGWALASEEDVVEAFGREAGDAPFFGVLSDRARVNATSKKRIADADREGMIEDVIAGRVRRIAKRWDPGRVAWAVAAVYGVFAFWMRYFGARIRSGDQGKGD